MINFDSMYETVKGSKKKLAVAHPYGKDVMAALENARLSGIAESILGGDAGKIKDSMAEAGINSDDYEIVNAPGEKEGALKSAEIVSSGKADALMKGKLPTAVFLKAALDEDVGLRTGSVLSHVVMLESKKLNKTFMITDSGMFPFPQLKDKVKILENAVVYAHRIGLEMPRVAVVTHVETVNEKMQATVDAALLSGMNKRGQISGALVEGPLGLDNALSEKAARIKGIDSPVAGNADILLVPDVVAGNLMAKAIMYTAECRFGGIVVGGKAPIIMLSRADDAETKLNSIVMGLV